MAGLIDGAIEPIPSRKIDLKTAEKFGYRVGNFSGQKCHIAPYHDASGNVVMQKVRLPNKEFAQLGEPKKVAGFFGQHLWRTGGKMVVVTEGEIDAMSAAQAMGLTWATVSLVNGASGAIKDFSNNIDWLEKFDKVVLLFDMDEPGQAAAEAAASLLTPGKAHLATLPVKDANEMVKAGRSEELVRAIWDARQFRPDGIQGVDELIEAAMQPPEWGFPWPWKTLTAATYGIRRGELNAFGAGVGSGKTTAFKQIVLTTVRPDLIEDHGELPIVSPQPRRAGLLFLEEPPKQTLRTLAGMALGARVHIPGVVFDEGQLRAEMERLSGWLYLYNHFGAKDYDTIKGAIRFMVVALGIKDIFLDHLTALVAGEEDERRSLDHIMADLAGMAQQYDFTLHFISHLTTPKHGNSHEEGGRVTEAQFTGSRAIARWANFMFGLERNKQDPDSPTTFRVLKDRNTGDANGLTFGLAYDRALGRLVEVELEDTATFKDETNGDL